MASLIFNSGEFEGNRIKPKSQLNMIFFCIFAYVNLFNLRHLQEYLKGTITQIVNQPKHSSIRFVIIIANYKNIHGVFYYQAFSGLSEYASE